MRKVIRYTLLLLCLCAFLCGCDRQEQTPAPAGSEVWETMPPVTYGVLESEKLQVLEWNSGRCEATSRNMMAETQLGFYYLNLNNRSLCYCDKTSFGNWFRVCNEPNCLHTPVTGCPAALVTTNSFLVKDNRIYHLASASSHPELYSGGGNGEILISCAANGTDLRLEYVLEDAMVSGGGGLSTRLTSGFWLYNSRELTADGQYHYKSFLMNANGTHLIHEELSDTEKEFVIAPVSTISGLMGEPAYFNTVLGTELCYRVAGDTMEPVDLTGLELAGAYLSGDVLRCFKQNDGYYDVDLNTRQEVRLADARMENSYCQIPLSNCIIEGTLLTGPSLKTRTDGMTHSLEIFDGEQWRSVILPLELETANKNVFIYVAAVTSDSILFECGGMGNDRPFYRVRLDAKELTLEPCEQAD